MDSRKMVVKYLELKKIYNWIHTIKLKTVNKNFVDVFISPNMFFRLSDWVTRGSHPRCSAGKVVIKILEITQENACVVVSFE